MKSRRFSLAAAIVLAGFWGLFAQPMPAAARDDVMTVRLFAAASTASALSDLVPLALEATGIRIVPVTAATSALARQIQAGAPADLFLAANPAWMETLVTSGAVAKADVRALLGNRLVVVSPIIDPSVFTDGEGLVRVLGDGRLAVADPRAVPAGQYARHLLTRLALWDKVSQRIAPAANVRAALALVERGAVPLGIVYESDARASKAVTVAWTPSPADQPEIVYTIAPTAAAPGRKAAERIVDFMLSSEGMTVFEAHGFRPL